MAKGFNPTELLGFVLIFTSEVDAYAAQRIKEPNGEMFIGITNELEGAHFWKKAKTAQKAIADYMEFVRDVVDDEGKATVLINRVTRSKGGQITQTNDRTLEFTRERY